LDEFDEMLVGIVDRVLKCSLGQENTAMIFEYLSEKSCSMTEIPRNLSLFSMELRNVLESEECRVRHSRANVMSSVDIIEETILRMLCIRIAKTGMKLGGIGLEELHRATFVEYVKRIKEAYLTKKVSQMNIESHTDPLSVTTEVK
jgi:hypothetical protein